MKNNKFLSLWGMPLLLAALTIFGLVAALTGTGIWHWLSWIALCIPLGVIIWFITKKTSAK